MTKLEELKKEINYRKDSNQCHNCSSFMSDFISEQRWGTEYKVEKNIRCSLYSFAIKKSTVCDSHTKKIVK